MWTGQQQKHLAFGSLVVEGTPVRLMGEDSRRGTFSQRHSTLIDYNNERRWVPLNTLPNAEVAFLGVRLAVVGIRSVGF